MRKLDDKLAALAMMSPAQLRGEWLQMFRAPAPPVGHKLLALRIAWRLQEKALGGNDYQNAVVQALVEAVVHFRDTHPGRGVAR